jgi:tetratricopeptide (TPR) repeat protein
MSQALATEELINGSLVPVSRQQARLLLEAGYLWLDMGRYDKAKEVFSGAAVLMPKSEVPQLALGTLEFSQANHEKALQSFRAAQRLAPRSSLPRAHAAEALLFLGKSGEAEKELKAALELEPDSDGARFAQALIDAKATGIFEVKPQQKK